jgi:glutamate-ammonia-ligase adenylyltransferase
MIFVADSKAKNLAGLQKLAVQVIDLMSSQTEMGVAFVTDARLRPDGAKGLLVNTLRAYEDYYRHRAMLWEIQTLTRARPISGNMELGQRFQEMAEALTNFSQPSLPLAAYTPNWKQEIAKMRQRIEKERVAAGKQALAFKTGAGGLMDVEFIAQTLCLEHGWHEPNTLRALQRAQSTQVPPGNDLALLIENYRKLWRIEGILRRWSYVGESELPDAPAPLYRVAVRCGFPNAAEFMKAVSQYRNSIRSVYGKFIGQTT